jgi:hypothetical protein
MQHSIIRLAAGWNVRLRIQLGQEFACWKAEDLPSPQTLAAPVEQQATTLWIVHRERFEPSGVFRPYAAAMDDFERRKARLSVGP